MPRPIHAIAVAVLVLGASPCLAGPPRIGEEARRMASSDEPVAVAARCAALAQTEVFLAKDAADRAAREARARDAASLVPRVAHGTGVDAQTAGAVLFLATDGVATRGSTLSPGGDSVRDPRCAGIAADPEGYLARLTRR